MTSAFVKNVSLNFYIRSSNVSNAAVTSDTKAQMRCTKVTINVTKVYPGSSSRLSRKIKVPFTSTQRLNHGLGLGGWVRLEVRAKTSSYIFIAV